MCDLNRATIEELAAFDGIGADTARELRLWRPYASWRDLESVPGIDPELVSRLRKAGATLDKVDMPDWQPPVDPFHW